MLTLRTILHPTDFSECSDFAFRLACSLARDSGAQVIVIYVAPSISAREEAATAPQGESQLRDKLLQLDTPDPEVWVLHQLVRGNPVIEILQTAKAVRCDLIVMGTRGESCSSSPVMGSVAEEVVRRAPCPVVTVRCSASDACLAEALLPELASRSAATSSPRQSDDCTSVALVVADQATD